MSARTLTQEIAHQRAKHGWSLSDLARALGCSVVMVSDLERGNRRPTAEMTNRLADALGLRRAHLQRLAAQDRGTVTVEWAELTNRSQGEILNVLAQKE